MLSSVVSKGVVGEIIKKAESGKIMDKEEHIESENDQENVKVDLVDKNVRTKSVRSQCLLPRHQVPLFIRAPVLVQCSSTDWWKWQKTHLGNS